MDDKENNTVNMKGVVCVISLKNKGNIIINAKSAIYNKYNNDTFFSEDIEIEYLNNLITSENFEG